MTARPKNSPFGPGLMRFLRELAKNNTRPWFEANKPRYERDVREPALAFIRAFEPHLQKISPHMVASDRKVGGSLMRIHRDVRFSKDKAPYKTNVGIQFRHEEGKDVHAPGFYLHIAPKEVFLGAGMWRPASEALAAVRASIDTHPKAWHRVRDAKAFTSRWALEGDSLKRAPKGYDVDHSEIVDLRRKDHIAVIRLTAKDVTRDDFVPFMAKAFASAKNYMAWQAKALELPF